ncbi:MAG: ATP-binding protein [Deltaproteobacteria bacterium]|nr:ATP-binding protein [Deltaproteobacteria bacterium]MBW1737797.1 ATP-binding protein [Deltaproteobacteria bacterium]MBW1908584.1 ATP-binding protein [Deltaproteobacteria bacterium]MBW2033113.1 ATP-binding protein [Deltaproteobacteria bacterium]MBW2113930.1 ATP-binding protein [Deltaproteobacteria bacterium]
MIPRLISRKLKKLIGQYPVVAITGPRQSGKTTLVKNVFPQRPYLTLEDPDIREFAIEDPRGFLSANPDGAILDEVQRVPDLFSYIQTRVDESGKEGHYILTGSFNFSLMEGISQSLAGRVGLLNLLPFSFVELDQANRLPGSLEDLLFTGSYPRIYDKKIPAHEWYANYVTTYLERDVRSIKNITDLDAFQRFLKMCAARSGQVLNLSSLGDDCGITHNTAKSWLSVLQTSFIVFLLKPHHKNFNKRLIKSSKLYFYDTGLLSCLLGIASPKNLSTHAFRGPVFETWAVSELLKGRMNRGLKENLYFWRDNSGHEIDCIIEKGDRLLPLEIKSGKTINLDFFKGLKYWSKISKTEGEEAYLVYGGSMDQKRKYGNVLGWKSFAERIPLID